MKTNPVILSKTVVLPTGYFRNYWFSCTEHVVIKQEVVNKSGRHLELQVDIYRKNIRDFARKNIYLREKNRK